MLTQIGNLSGSPRILIVDNEKRTVHIFQDLISHWGYVPIIASGEGPALLEDAKNKAREYRCQLALVDMRLIDDSDNDDISGLELVNQIRPAISIVVSGHGNLKIAVGSIQKNGAAGFVEKNDLPLGLQEKIKWEAAKNCAHARELKIYPSEIMVSIKKTLFDANVAPEYHDQVEDILARLFPTASTLRLEKMNTGDDTSGIATAPRPRSVVLKVYEDEFQPVIIKLARKTKIKKETNRFSQYIKGRLVGNFVPKLEDSCCLWDIGGIKFSYVGSIDQTFGHFFQSASVPTIEKTLERFFKITWSYHFKRAKDRFDVSLFELYCSVLDHDWYERALKFKIPNPEIFMGADVWRRINAKDPIEWLIQKIGSNTTGDASHVAKTSIAVTHGDLHADNMLVDDSQNAWVIDFERSGEGHALQDFIELESDIINRMTLGNQNFSDYYHLCLAVASSQTTGKMNIACLADAGSDMQKVIQIIATIRSLAQECTGIVDARQYMLGLFFNTIFRATIDKDFRIMDDDQIRSQRSALMLASILCFRLEHWDEPWPPKQWENLQGESK